MSRALWMLPALAIAGCSAEPEAVASNEATAAAAPAPVVATGSAMRAEVSALTADTSGLQVRVTDTATIVDLPADTLFAFDKADLAPGAEANLGKAADAIRRGGAGPIAIVGHTDAKGSDDYNLDLSERRANTVADWMKQQVGVRQRTFDVRGLGEAQPIAANARPDGSDDPAGRAKNRRVEIVIPR